MKCILALIFLTLAPLLSADPTADITITYRSGKGPDVTATVFSHNLSTYAVIPVDLTDHTTWLVTVTSQDREHGIPTGRPFWTQIIISDPATVVAQKNGDIPLEIAETLFRFDVDHELKFFESSTKGELTVKFSNFSQ
jgi:hypothetical protein